MSRSTLLEFQNSDRHLECDTPNVTVVERKKVWFIDVSITGNSQTEEKQLGKIITTKMP